jgi:hypothetical protein
VIQSSEHRGERHLAVLGLGTALERGFDQALRLGVAHAVAEEI